MKFSPLDTAKLRLEELRRGQVVPSSAVYASALAGAPLSQLVIGALGELGVTIGPNTAGLLAVLISTLCAYLTRAGRRP